MSSSLTTRGALLLGLTKGPGYGLELTKRIQALTNGHIRIILAAVYPILRGMEEEGLLRSWEGEPVAERGGRPRRYYELTAIGIRSARAEHAALRSLLDGVGEDVIVGGAHAST
jgi:PadR family transcriptional regulator PadR